MTHSEDEARLSQLRGRAAELGLTLELRHQNTPGQLQALLPVRSLDYWGAILKRDGRTVASDSRNTSVAAAEAAFAAYRRLQRGSE
jgi:hypothetical protein